MPLLFLHECQIRLSSAKYRLHTLRCKPTANRRAGLLTNLIDRVSFGGSSDIKKDLRLTNKSGYIIVMGCSLFVNKNHLEVCYWSKSLFIYSKHTNVETAVSGLKYNSPVLVHGQGFC